MKNLLELTDALEATSQAFVKAAADGKIGAEDLPHVFAPVNKWKDAISDISVIGEEIKTGTPDNWRQAASDITNTVINVFAGLRMLKKTAPKA